MANKCSHEDRSTNSSVSLKVSDKQGFMKLASTLVNHTPEINLQDCAGKDSCCVVGCHRNPNWVGKQKWEIQNPEQTLAQKLQEIYGGLQLVVAFICCEIFKKYPKIWGNLLFLQRLGFWKILLNIILGKGANTNKHLLTRCIGCTYILLQFMCVYIYIEIYHFTRA